MKIIEKPPALFLSVWVKQAVKENVPYRPLRYIRQIPVQEGTLFFNMLSGELILLTEEERALFTKGADSSNEIVKQLIEKWFLVPEDTVDSELSKKVTALFQGINSIYSAPKLQTFTILPTTDCNARCFYCYELGCSRKWMTKKTADDVVDYIMRKKCDGEIKIHWFGGEPLYNVEIIDYISEELKKRGVKYRSHMVSNGYLFDDDMIGRAKDLWKLEKVQITIDGTEEVYNRVKAYIYKNVDSPFKRVVENSLKLMKAGIAVHIRMNMDMHNIDDLYALTDYLTERFQGNKNYMIYAHLLYNTGKKYPGDRDEEYLKTKYLELCDRLEKLDPRDSEHFEIMHFGGHCMADTDTSVLILPEGQIGKCEHYTDDHFIGSIYDDNIDIKRLNEFKQMGTPLKKCDDCDMRPACVHLKICPNHKEDTCSALDKREKESRLETRVRYLYRYYKEKKQ